MKSPDRALSDEVIDHYRRTHGLEAREAEFRRGANIIRVLKWTAKSEPGPPTLYATVGASDFTEQATPTHRVEFLVMLDAERDDVADALAELAIHAAETGVPVRADHTMELTDPLWPGTEMRSFLVIRSGVPLVPVLEASGDLHVEFLLAIPIFDSELALKKGRGVGALTDLWREREVVFEDPDRLPVPA